MTSLISSTLSTSAGLSRQSTTFSLTNSSIAASVAVSDSDPVFSSGLGVLPSQWPCNASSEAVQNDARPRSAVREDGARRSAAALTLQEQVAVTYEKSKSCKGLGKRGRKLERKRLWKRSQPRYVTACQQKEWTLGLCEKGKPESARFVPYKCLSWRCEGDCSRCAGKQWFARIKTALDAEVPEHICLLVTTLDPSQWKGKLGKFVWSKKKKKMVRRFVSAQDRMYLESNKCWMKLQKRLTRLIGKFDFITVVEQHKSGNPHFNIAIVSKRLAVLMASRTDAEKKAKRWDSKSEKWVESSRWSWLEENAAECGFGRVCYADLARNRDAIAGYIVKAAGGGANAVAGEIAKVSQLPVSAPQGFRRIRASFGFLPPKFKNENLSGKMIFKPVARVNAVLDAAWAGVPSVLREVAEHDRASVVAAEVARAPSLMRARERGESVNVLTGEVAVDLLGDVVLASSRKRRVVLRV